MPNFHQQEEGNQTKNRRKQVHFYLFFFLLNSNKYMRCSGLFFPFFSEAGGLKSFIFIYLSVCLFVFFSSNPNMVESGDSSRERSSSLFFWLDGKQHSQSVVKEGGKGRTKDRSKKRGQRSQSHGGCRGKEGMKVSPHKYVLLPPAIYCPPPPSLPTEKWGRGEESERERASKIWLSISSYSNPKCVTFL